MTSTTVPGSTGNCVVVSIVLVHSVFSPVQSGAVEVIPCVIASLEICNFHVVQYIDQSIIYRIYNFRQGNLTLCHGKIGSKQLISFTCLPSL